jgi:oligopeptide/dipeptide ABC transporter ATP-binding protein
MAMDLILIENLKIHFFLGKGVLSRLFGRGLRIVHAVDGVSFAIREGRTFGLVGESGCGKSTLGQSIFRLTEPIQGRILYKAKDVFKASPSAIKEFRRNAQIIFQDPFGSLNPRMTAGQIIAEPLYLYGSKAGRNISAKVAELLEAVNLPPRAALKFPNEFSGGQARRIGVARAIALEPEFIAADEPTSGLDISTAATILNLMQDLKERMKLTYLWISHNLDQVRYMSDDIAVMYLGRIVEMGNTQEVLNNLLHPYSQALISSIPRVDHSASAAKIILKGEIPSPINPPSGCRFRTRCRYAHRKCEKEEPGLTDIGDGHYLACHLRGTSE